jgi:NAD-dependent deacetylase
MLDLAAEAVGQADTVIIVGTSMQVYPAAGLVGYAKPAVPVFYVDPKPSLNYELRFSTNLKIIAENASTGVRKVVEELKGAN